MLPGLLREPLQQERGKLIEKTITDVTVDVLRQIFDDDLAPQLLAKETDVGADDGTEIEENRLGARAQTRNETSQHLRWVDGCIRGTSLRLSVFLATTGEQI